MLSVFWGWDLFFVCGSLFMLVCFFLKMYGVIGGLVDSFFCYGYE